MVEGADDELDELELTTGATLLGLELTVVPPAELVELEELD